jgi:hypothetical protein
LPGRTGEVTLKFRISDFLAEVRNQYLLPQIGYSSVELLAVMVGPCKIMLIKIMNRFVKRSV